MTAPADVLDQLDALRAAATPGPWLHPRMRGDVVTSLWGHNVQNVLSTHDIAPMSKADAALIVAAVNSLPDLIAALRAVLDLHKPYELPLSRETLCNNDEFLWPCETYRAIADALARPADVTTEGERR